MYAVGVAMLLGHAFARKEHKLTCMHACSSRYMFGWAVYLSGIGQKKWLPNIVITEEKGEIEYLFGEIFISSI